MLNNKNTDLEQIDFKLVLAFTNAYEELYEKGEITEEQFEKILTLIETYQNYSQEEFKEKLNYIFK